MYVGMFSYAFGAGCFHMQGDCVPTADWPWVCVSECVCMYVCIHCVPTAGRMESTGLECVYV
jgi:hypothetical protein